MATNTFWILCVVAICVLSVDGTMKEEIVKYWKQLKRNNVMKRCLKQCEVQMRSCIEDAYGCPYYEQLTTYDLILECNGNFQDCKNKCNLSE
ncbi:hypothetical protein LSAT2_021018 [Lamellibrachia satsuma]|nr:hypothetical protein LSAT2_021018 [Lamellibrachia satsuma]